MNPDFVSILLRASLSFIRVLSDPWNRTIPMNVVGRAYCVSSTRSSSLKDASINAKSK